jgi:hypothetical protein
MPKRHRKGQNKPKIENWTKRQKIKKKITNLKKSGKKIFKVSPEKSNFQIQPKKKAQTSPKKQLVKSGYPNAVNR